MQLFSPTSRRIQYMNISNLCGTIKLAVRRVLYKVLNRNIVSTIIVQFHNLGLIGRIGVFQNLELCISLQQNSSIWAGMGTIGINDFK